MRSVLAALLLLLFALPLQATERILSYDSDITVRADGSQAVTETIQVRAEGVDIKRGIYRDFPTDYYTRYGRHVRVKFEVSGVERDGRPEPFHTQRLDNGVRVYVGRGDVFLDPGTYTYRLSYVTDRQLGFFKDHDELYWNVTGNGWMFAIDKVTARVRLPEGVPADRIEAEAYTGQQGAKGRDYEAQATEGGAAFVSTRALGPGEGLTLVVGWPKGVVREPTMGDRLREAWADNRALFVCWTGVALLLLYYLFAWRKVGRDPAAGVIVPLYEPPAGYTPAALRLVRDMVWDDKTLSAALVGLAVRGALTIREDDDEYEVTPTGKPAGNLSADEQAILNALGGQPLAFKRSNYVQVRALCESHKDALQRIYEKSHFYSNRAWLAPGWLMTLAVIVAAIGLRNAGTDAPWGLLAAVATVVLNAVFTYLMKAPTTLGRKVLDDIEGFRQYLGIAESDELKFKYAKAVTPQVFEAYLPYAIALDVETRWAERFAASLRASGQQPSEYRTSWYQGSSFSGVSGLTKSCSTSLPSTVSSSSSPPGSSSGSSGGGGGGSSGGGGGGGGGGGW
jgi:uncharacterized membrane protein YgcG